MLGLAVLYSQETEKLHWIAGRLAMLESRMDGPIPDPAIVEELARNRTSFAQDAELLKARLPRLTGKATDLRRRTSRVPHEPGATPALPGQSNVGDDDLLLVARYRRVCQHGIGAVGVVRAIAEALGEVAAARRLARMLGYVQTSDEVLVDLVRHTRHRQPSFAR